MSDHPSLYIRFASAYVRGKLGHSPCPHELEPLFRASLASLIEEQMHLLIRFGHEQGLRLHRFKRTMGLPRVARVLGILRGISPSDLLDIGSGRGAFLWPLLDAFPWLPITALDRLDYRVADIQAVSHGGVDTLTGVQGDATSLPFDDDHFDVVTMLEVLEHIPDTTRALADVCRVAKRFVILSVPSKPDNNREHIHLFSTVMLQRALHAAGAKRVALDYVPGHIIAIAALGG